MQRDYILRIIEQAGTILKHLLVQVQAQRSSDADRTRELQRAAQVGGLDLDMLRISDMEGIWQQVALTGEPDPARTWLAAEMLYVDGLGAEVEGEVATALASYGKAASLFRMMQPTWVLPTGFPEAATRLEEIDGRLEALRSLSDRSAPPGR